MTALLCNPGCRSTPTPQAQRGHSRPSPGVPSTKPELPASAHSSGACCWQQEGALRVRTAKTAGGEEQEGPLASTTLPLQPGTSSQVNAALGGEDSAGAMTVGQLGVGESFNT